MCIKQFMDFVKKLATGEVSMEDKDEVDVVFSSNMWSFHVQLVYPVRWLPLVTAKSGLMNLKRGWSQEMVVSGVNWRRNGMNFQS